MKIDLKTIIELVPTRIYNSGVVYYQNNLVEIIKITNNSIEAFVLGTAEYFVTIERKTNGEIHAECDCPYEYYCKHIVAVLLTANDYYPEGSFTAGKSQIDIYHPHEKQYTNLPLWKQYIQLQHTDKLKIEKQYKVMFELQLLPKIWKIIPHTRNIKKNGEVGRELPFSYNIFEHPEMDISINEKIVLNHLFLSNPVYYQKDKSIYFRGFDYASDTGSLLIMLKNSNIYSDNDLKSKISYHPHEVKIIFLMEEIEDFFSLRVKLTDEKSFSDYFCHEYKILTSGHIHLFKNNTIYQVKNKMDISLLLPFTEKEYRLNISYKNFNEFISGIYPKIPADTEFSLPTSLVVRSLDSLNKKRLYLHEEKGQLIINLKFTYGNDDLEISCYPFNKVQLVIKDHIFYKIYRQDKVEEFWKKQLIASGLLLDSTEFTLAGKQNILTWLFDQIPSLLKKGLEIYGEDKLKKFKIIRSYPFISTHISTNIDWFDLKIDLDFDGIKASFKEIYQAIKYQTNYIALTDGSIARIDHELLKKLAFIKNLSHKSDDDRRLRFSKYQILLLDEILQYAQKSEVDPQYRNSIQNLKNFKGIHAIHPKKSFKGVLRTYQKFGLDWLHFLHEYQFGGCLADDMGLGKTIQALALLQLKQKEKTNASLIVTPTSVLDNWQHEIKRFTPDLSVLIYSGNNRHRYIKDFKLYDIILTSYALLWRDYNHLSQIQFYYMILDESQKIKNPGSLTARCARGLHAAHRIVMTGTPLENNILEIWSQFQFLNPGMLGSLQSFKENFVLPIEKESNHGKAERLRNIIYPFILRRTKDEVAKELPPKIENVVYCTMDEKQEKIYNKWRDYYRVSILQQIEHQGFSSSTMKILEGLTKLRQISIHPRMIDPKYKHSSGKFEHLIDTIEDISQEGHKVLIFSQFVKMLWIIRGYLDQEHYPYAYLDGKTRKRQKQIDKFQNDPDIKIFLISLKAGGTGLNLTAADYVIHVDPWWNPAVELQATDRAHRIGQEKKVFVYKLITSTTVEEKILELQKHKKELTKNIITTDSTFFKKLTMQDIKILLSA
jgi:non-specific serine/threonine protein kinase